MVKLKRYMYQQKIIKMLRDDEVVIIIQTINNHDFFDIRKLEDE